MVTPSYGFQLVVVICLFYTTFLIPEGASVVALRRLSHYEIPENFENLSTDDLALESEIPLMKSLDSESEEIDDNEVEPPSARNVKNEGKEGASLRTTAARWLFPPPSENKFIQDLLRHQFVTALPPMRDEYRIDVQDLVKGEEPVSNQNKNYGSGLQNLRTSAFGKTILPLHQIYQPSQILPESDSNPFVNRGETTAKTQLYYPFNGISMDKRRYGNNLPAKRWWGSHYKPRPQMDRRATQSKHYGCLKRCISIGKLHPIQCHTLC